MLYVLSLATVSVGSPEAAGVQLLDWPVPSRSAGKVAQKAILLMGTFLTTATGIPGK